MTRPYVTLSCAMSLDGYLDSAAPGKLAMSNAADFDRVDQLRAESDAIRQALAVAAGNLSRAAELLGITRPTLYDLVEKNGITVPDRAAEG